MNHQPPLSPTEKVLAIVVCVLVLGVGLVSLWGGGWCFENPDSWTYSSGWRCAAPGYVLALLTLSFTSGGSFFMFRRRYGLALTLMVIPTVIWFVW